jgi:hypothetical protein
VVVGASRGVVVAGPPARTGVVVGDRVVVVGGEVVVEGTVATVVGVVEVGLATLAA